MAWKITSATGGMQENLGVASSALQNPSAQPCPINASFLFKDRRKETRDAKIYN
jgi:hypothetical protein